MRGIDQKRLGRWLPLAVIALTAILYLFRLGTPARQMFDEVYYARDANSYLRGATEDNRIDACNRKRFRWQVCSWVHPPLGKWLIAAGEKFGGYNAWGWRISPALGGIALVALVIALGTRLFLSRIWGSVAGFLVALDGLIFVQARTSMLDIFLALFVVAGFLALVADRRTRKDSPGGLLPWRRAVAGVCFGAAAAVKWTGVLALAAGGLLALGWALGAWHRRHREQVGGPVWRSPLLDQVATEVASLSLAFVAIPIGVYLLSYLPWMVDNGFSLGRFVDLHRAMWSYHATLTADHPYKSPAWKWPLLIRPVAYYYKEKAGRRMHIFDLGNPMLWWPAIPALVTTAWQWVRRRGMVSATILIAYAFLYLPWLAVRRPQFLFYMTPVVPFMALALAWCLAWLWERTWLGEEMPAPAPVVVPEPAPVPEPIPATLMVDTRGAPGITGHVASPGPPSPPPAPPGVWPPPPAPSAPRGPEMLALTRWLVIAILALVLIAFVVLYPVWTGVPITARWWNILMLLGSWI